MKRKRFPALAPVVVVVVAAWAIYSATSAPTGDVGATNVSATFTHDNSVGGAGYMVYVDPVTGKAARPPQTILPIQYDASLRQALSTSSKGLVEVPSPVSGGGVMVDLQGRFQNTAVATVGKDGKVTAPCVIGQPHQHDDTDDHTSNAGKE